MILQFGTGNFLRAFADLFVGELEPTPGPVIAIQSTGKERADAINRSGGSYHVAIQGFERGRVVDRTQRVTSIERALHAGSEWRKIRRLACRDDLQAILSNTTEAGLALDERDHSGDRPHFSEVPISFPAKLLALLIERHQAGLPGTWIVPCELVEGNGDRLLCLVLEQADRWAVSCHTVDWIRHRCHWPNTLVDRIVPGPPSSHPLLDTDPLLLSCEPFAFWAVQTGRDDFPLAAHPVVVTAADISAYTLRKVRILNGAHSALVSRALNSELRTVRECVEDPQVGGWLRQVLFEEIVPVLAGRCEDPEGFARTVLDRFRNPFLDHQLSAIALHHDSKLKVRLQPTVDEYREKFSASPPLLSQLDGLD